MKKSIQLHFERTAHAVDYIKSVGESGTLKINEVLLLPLIRRTKSIIELARSLERDRDALFEPLRRYEETVNKFVKPKRIEVTEDGALTIMPEDVSGKTSLTAEHLSSGEKQILILLTQALLNEGQPVVYMADEPELSLHVEWQAMLLDSVVALAGEVQIIVATHSPDIVSHFHDNVIPLEVPQ